ncbi:integumentary mucin C.1-like [Mercenaria mercenaria]|uniref:integumentary mucin C.1-like n=1 Tax=Mercenaria mercenaria TaxID=6596 RepID=UPI00234E5244|nr:integumentary mucin C.1-like [Mercenaria mercenaria]
MKTTIIPFVAACAIIQQASGHGGRLMDPPSRSSAWRVGFPTPRNYGDNDVSCGGFLTLVTNGGKCGVCGDPWDGKRDNEAGGKYATGTIVRKYQIGQTISIKVDLTGNHLGWMEFRICPNNDVNKSVTHDCLNSHVLQRADGTGARTQVNNRNMGTLSMAYTLPDGMTCSQCVLQWKFQTDDTWGVDKDTGKACIGCGYQEEFYGCADVAIGAGGTEPQHTFTPKGPRVQLTQNSAGTGKKLPCKGIHNWANDPDMDRWCTDNCAIGNCPSYGCDCSNGTGVVTEKTTTTTLRPTTTTRMTTPTTASTTTTTTTQKPTSSSTTTTAKTPQSTVEMIKECKATNLWTGNEFLDRWCADSCSRGNCPSESCKCTMVQKGVTQSTTTTLQPKTTEDKHRKVCHAISLWKGIQVFDMWCTEECNKGNCPDDTCQCTDNSVQPNTATTTTTTTTSTSLGKCVSNGIVGGEYWNGWCQKNCDTGHCDTGYCFCNV